MDASSPSHSLSVTASASGIVSWAFLELLWIGLWVAAGATLVIKIINPWPGLSTSEAVQLRGINILLLLFVSWTIFLATRFAFKIQIRGDSLETVSLRGHRHLNLQEIESVRLALLFGGKYGKNTYTYKITDTSGHKVFVRQQAFSKADRTQLIDALRPYLEKPHTNWSDKTNKAVQDLLT